MQDLRASKRLAWYTTLALLATACAAGSATAVPGEGAKTGPGEAVSSTVSDRPAEFECPVTIPDDGFVPPDGYPEVPSVPGHVWYGTAELWTTLPMDGTYQPRKSVWWSVNFGGGRVEERPEISVLYERLDRPGERHTHPAPGTNAYTVPDGWFMMAGIDPEEPGCWQVTASYKGATLSYVVDSRP